jgi:UDP:flavonoid glycosyltransferase YjiC (YdhE family)
MKMRVLLTSLGSMGDVQPLFALAAHLARRGHSPTLALSPNFEARAAALGLKFVRLGPEMKRADVRAVVGEQIKTADLATQVGHFMRAVDGLVPQFVEELRVLGQDADLLVSTPFQIASRIVHETIGVPYATLHFSPFGSLGGSALRTASAPSINRWRTRFGLPELHDPLGTDGPSPQLALYAVSPQLFRRPRAWPAHHHLTGFFFLEEAWAPDRELVDFIEAGPPPVVITFGSVVHENADAVTSTLVEAVQRAGVRAVLQSGWSGLGRGSVHPRDGFAVVDFVPHDWLFSRGACIVHHGGAGTTAAALRSGRPAVVVPHSLDQPIWGEFARGLGCTGAVIPYEELTAAHLADAIRKSVSDDRHRTAAARVAERLNVEDGVGAAGEHLERLGSSPARRSS